MPQEKPAPLADFPMFITLPVQWGDMDAFGHVNNAVPARWFESARIAYLEQAGLKEMMAGEAAGPIVASLTLHYRKQITYPDTVHVAARVGRMGRSSFTMEHAVYSEAGDWICADGEAVVVVFDYRAQRPVRVPDSIRQTVARFQQSSGESGGS